MLKIGIILGSTRKGCNGKAGMSKFQPAAYHDRNANEMLNQLIAWSTALKPIRESRMLA